MREKARQANRLEDYQPGASRKQIFGALNKVVKSSKPNGNGNGSHTEKEQTEEEVVKIVADAVIDYNREAFKELERH